MISFDCIKFLWAWVVNCKGRFKCFPNSRNFQHQLLKLFQMSILVCAFVQTLMLRRRKNLDDGFSGFNQWPPHSEADTYCLQNISCESPSKLSRILHENSNVPLFQFLSPNYLGFPRKAVDFAQYVVAKNNPRWANLSCCNFASTASPVWTFLLVFVLPGSVLSPLVSSSLKIQVFCLLSQWS